MFSGAQLSLYPMSDDFVGIILGAIEALEPYRPQFRIETDDVSTLIVGPPDRLFPAMRDLFLGAARTGVHCVLSAAVSRGCPGEPDDLLLRLSDVVEEFSHHAGAILRTRRRCESETEDHHAERHHRLAHHDLQLVARH